MKSIDLLYGLALTESLLALYDSLICAVAGCKARIDIPFSYQAEWV
jgi:hypothetical protein